MELLVGISEAARRGVGEKAGERAGEVLTPRENIRGKAKESFELSRRLPSERLWRASSILFEKNWSSRMAGESR